MTLEERCKWIRERVNDLVGEHCEAFVFIATVKDEESGDSMTPLTWDGGINHALGLATRAQQDLIDDTKSAKPEAPKDDDGDDWKQGVK